MGVPQTIASAAVSAARRASKRRGRPRNSYEERDQVWAVFDKDEHPGFEDAVASCEANGVAVARSNPCFEVWLVLHERDYDKPDGRHAVQTLLRTIRPEYDPNGAKTPDCADLVTRIDAAEKRAVIQLARREAEGAPYGSPSTTVFRLTQALRAPATNVAPSRAAAALRGVQSRDAAEPSVQAPTPTAAS